MQRIKPSAIKEITREITLGNTCYLHKISRKITTINHSIEDAKLIADQEKKQAEIERKIDRYIKIENLSTKDQHLIMKEFLDEPLDRSFHRQLTNALNRKNPVRNFNQAVESDIGLNQQWRNFSFDESQRWVSNFILDAYHYGTK